VVQRHSPQEQITIVLEGLLEFEVGGRGFTAVAGGMCTIPPSVEHSAAVTDAVVVGVFSPPRDDWKRRA